MEESERVERTCADSGVGVCAVARTSVLVSRDENALVQTMVSLPLMLQLAVASSKKGRRGYQKEGEWVCVDKGKERSELCDQGDKRASFNRRGSNGGTAFGIPRRPLSRRGACLCAGLLDEQEAVTLERIFGSQGYQKPSEVLFSREDVVNM